MDLIGSLVDTNVKIYPNEKLIQFFKSLPTSVSSKNKLPHNILQIVKSSKGTCKTYNSVEDVKPVTLSTSDIDNIKKIKDIVSLDVETESKNNATTDKIDDTLKADTEDDNTNDTEDDNSKNEKNKLNEDQQENIAEFYLVTADLDWLYNHLKERRTKGEKDIPYLHMLLQDATIKVPENKIIKRNPDLEARCVKLRAQQEAREYRKMTKGVDNVRMRFPEDSISYQLKQMNRQLIAILQFIISIFAGFLFGFRGVEWMVGNLDFGFRLLLGVMCALVIALAEIYFLAKKLNEELNIPETVQLGGPLKFADESKNDVKPHQD